MSSQLVQSLDAMADDWLSMATFIDLQLCTVQDQEVVTRKVVLEELFKYFSQTNHLEQLSAIAWDLIIPLSNFMQSELTRTNALKLFHLAVEHGNQKEVLLKLIEASTVLDYDAEDYSAQIELQLILLEAQEKIIKQIRTKRPSLFTAEYTKGILEAIQRPESAAVMPGLIRRYEAHITESVLHGALRHLEGTTDASDQEKHAMQALMQSFFTYILAISAGYYSTSHSSRLFLAQHPHLNVPSPPSSISARSKRDQPEDGEKFLQLVKSRFTDMEQLWECGSWALHENEDPREETDQDSDQGLETGDVPLSPTGSVVLLAELLSETRVQHGQIKDHQPLSQRLGKCQEVLMQLCARQDPNFTTLDSCLYLCGLAIADLADSSRNRESDEDLLFVQTLSSISATTPHAELRQVAHYLVKDFLVYTSDQFRYDYYAGVLSECPFEILKTATLGLIKDELAGDSKFWSSEDKVYDLLEKALAWTHEDEAEAEADEIRSQLWIQTVNFIIFLLQRYPRSSRIRSMSRTWKESLAKYLNSAKGGEGETNVDLFYMYLTRVEQLLSVA